MFRNSIPILSIVIFVLSGYVLSRAGIGEHDSAFSAELDVIRPWEDNCNYYKQMNYSHYSCPNGLFDPDSVELENFRNSLYIMKLKIGSNEKEFRVAVDTGSSRLWVFDDACANCEEYTKYKATDSETSEFIDDKFKIKYGTGSVKGKSMKDTVYLTADMEVEKQIFGAVDEVVGVKFPCDGLLGLNMKKYLEGLPTFLHAVADGKIAKPSFGVYIQGGGNKGEITFGGVNKAHLKEETKVTTKITGTKKIMLQMKKLEIGDTELCKEEDGDCEVTIDTGCSIIKGPKKEVEDFNRDKLSTNKQDKWEVDCEKIEDFPNLIVTFGEKTLTLEPEYYIRKFGTKCYSGIQPRSKKHWNFGDNFMTKFYVEFDLKSEDGKVSFYESK